MPPCLKLKRAYFDHCTSSALAINVNVPCTFFELNRYRFLSFVIDRVANGLGE